MGALLAGVFCGVLVSGLDFFFLGDKQERGTYGATGKSAFLFLMGSDMMMGVKNEGGRGVEGKGE